MYLERLQVEEGFLDGLDVAFAPGLNVIVGARGTGKTSLIELVRYALGAPAFTEEALTRGNAQAVSVLQGGRVAVTLRTATGVGVVERDAGAAFQGRPDLDLSCTVLAQNEIEAIGAQPLGRLHLLDRFRRDRSIREASLLEAQRRVESQTRQLLGLIAEASELLLQTQALDETTAELNAALAEQSSILETVQATEADRSKLAELQTGGRILGAQKNILDRTAVEIAHYQEQFRALLARGASLAEEWPIEAGDVDLLAQVRLQVRSARDLLAQADQKLSQAVTATETLSNSVQAGEAELTEVSRELRQKLEALQVGASSVTRRVATLQERVGQYQALRALLEDRRSQFRALQEQRDSTYSAMEDHRQLIFEERQSIAASLTKSLAPAIRVTVTKSARTDAYSAAISASLRGSGLHYNSLAPILAQRMSPLELTRAAENFDADELNQATGIGGDRAQSVLAALRSGGTAAIAGATIDDAVSLELLDGSDYKSTESLSIGQRCTVVLPLLLNERGDPLLVDQPEDHLDNAFIVSTLVKALNSRRDGDQFIFASHNANIPVLANADNVIVLDSDGRRGYVAHAGPLDDPKIVKHISTIMEGGADAFATRAAFYSLGRAPR